MSYAPSLPDGRREQPGTSLDTAVDASLCRATEGARASIDHAADRAATRERLLCATVESSEDAIITTSLDRIITSWNAAATRLFGYREDEVLGKHINLYIPAERQSEVVEIQKQIDSTGPVRHFETMRLAKDGRRIPVSCSISQIKLASGEPIGVAAIVRDITDRIAAAEQLHHAQKMEVIGQLTGGIAHDFNNLLTIILGNAETIIDGLPPDHRLRELATMTAMAAERGAELTSRLLAFARRQPLAPKSIDVNEQLLHMESSLRHSLPDSVHIEIVSGDDLWPAMVDPAQMEIAILNLATNARDAMTGSGRLTLRTSNVILDESHSTAADKVAAGPYVLLAVTDSGSGMDQTTLRRAFDPFFTTKEVGKGSGLGLSMVFGFVKQSNGHVKIHSEPGHGTTVHLYLPKAGQDDKSRPAGDAPSTDRPQKILLAEDDSLVREFAATQLRSMGYQVVCASDGVEALDILKRVDGFSLLFTDVLMPRLNGRQLALKAHELRPDLPVLFTSGYMDRNTMYGDGAEVGMNLLNKPYRRHELADKVRLAIDGTEVQKTQRHASAIRSQPPASVAAGEQ